MPIRKKRKNNFRQIPYTTLTLEHVKFEFGNSRVFLRRWRIAVPFPTPQQRYRTYTQLCWNFYIYTMKHFIYTHIYLCVCFRQTDRRSFYVNSRARVAGPENESFSRYTFRKLYVQIQGDVRYIFDSKYVYNIKKIKYNHCIRLIYQYIWISRTIDRLGNWHNSL